MKDQERVDSPRAIADLKSAAATAVQAGDFPRAIKLYSTILDSGRISEAETYELLGKRAACHGKRGDLQGEMVDRKEQVALSANLPDPRLHIQALIEFTQVTALVGQTAESQQNAELALRLAQEIGDTKLEADSIVVMGETFRARGEYPAAVEKFTSAIDLYRKVSDRQGEATCLRNLGAIYINVGDRPKSEECLRRALKIFSQIGDRYGEARCLNGLGLNEPDKAIARTYMEQALAIFDSLGEKLWSSTIYNNLGLLYASLGLYDTSRFYCKQGVDIPRSMGAFLHVANNLESLGRTYVALGRYDLAEETFFESKQLAEEMGDKFSQAYDLLGLGVIHLKLQQPELALKDLDPAIDLMRELNTPAELGIALTQAAVAYLQLDDVKSARNAAQEAVRLIEAPGVFLSDFQVQEIYWQYYRILTQSKRKAAGRGETPLVSKKARHVLEKAYKWMMASIETLSDAGLRRNYLNKVEVNRLILAEWKRQAALVAGPDEKEEIDQENLLEQFKRLVNVGVRMNDTRQPSELYEFVLNHLVELSGAERVFLMLVDENGNKNIAAVFGFPNRRISLKPYTGILQEVINSQRPRLELFMGAFDDIFSHISRMAAPLVVGEKAVGVIYAEIGAIYGQFSETDLDLLLAFANQASTAIENARLVDDLEKRVAQRTAELESTNSSLEQRNSELAIINSIQQGLASNLDMQAIFDLVGDKIQERFQSQVTGIVYYDRNLGMLEAKYYFVEGLKLPLDELPAPFPFGEGLSTTIIREKRAILVNRDAEKRLEKMGAVDWGEENPTKAWLGVPILAGDEAIGTIIMENYEDANAYSETDINLLKTLAASMGVALENARLFKAEQERAAELAIINSVGQGLAKELDFQSIIDLVGDKISEIFSVQELSIRLYDQVSHTITFPYIIENGKRIQVEPRPVSGGFAGHIIQNRTPILIRTVDESNQLSQELEGFTIPGTLETISFAGVPILAGDLVIGVITMEGVEENAFNESDLNLLTTLASNLGVALQNARLFDETRRLFEAEQQRAAELTILNSVGEAMSRQLDVATITRLVGDKVLDITKAPSVQISLVEQDQGMINMVFAYDRGYLELPPPIPIGKGLTSIVIESRKPLILGTYEESDSLDVITIPGNAIDEEETQSYLGVPIIAGENVIGVVSVQDYPKYAFDEDSARLLTTLSSSMGVAIQNARLFEAEKQRAAELALISSVQRGLASQLEMQAIYDLVGDRIRDIFDAQIVMIITYDRNADLCEFPYTIEKGERLFFERHSPMGFSSIILRTGQSLRIDEQLMDRARELGSPYLGGEIPRSWLGVPLKVGDEARGVISLQNIEKEHAFSDSDQRLLETLASSMAVALENARLFEETKRLLTESEQRTSELTIISGVSQAMVQQLDFQAIIELVGDEVRKVFNGENTFIALYDQDTDLVRFPYWVNSFGDRIPAQSRQLSGLTGEIVHSRKPLVLNTLAEAKEHGAIIVDDGKGDTESWMGVPILVGNSVKGVIGVQDFPQFRYLPSDVRLLQTLASSMGVALENARLFDETKRLLEETQQRNAELAVINSVQQGLVSNLEFQGIIDLVGDTLREVFHTGDIGVRIYDQQTDMVHYVYEFEHGQRLEIEPLPMQGLSRYIIETRQPFVVNTNMAEMMNSMGITTIPGTDQARSAVGVPIIAGNNPIGLIILENHERESAYGEADIRLLTTLAASLSVALENARLFEETRRLLDETKQRAAELAIINSVGQALASKLEVQAVFDLVGDQIREIFDAQVVALVTYDKRTNRLHYPYLIEMGERLFVGDDPLDDKGFAPYIIRNRTPLMFNRDMERHASEFGSYAIAGEMSKAYLGVPLIIGDEARGVISLQNIEREDAFTESDLHLLTTLASSLSVALENARLFEETTRLLEETQQRNAELAVINTVQQGLVSNIEFQGIIDLVGDTLRDVFHTQDLTIRLYDRQADLVKYVYFYEHGNRLEIPDEHPVGFNRHIITTRQLVLINHDLMNEAGKYGSKVLPGTDAAKSFIAVPIITGDAVTGVISVENHEREGAFSESDQRLLTTLSASLSVALENARLFEETTRLLKETQERNAELAVINQVGQSLAAQLDPQQIFEFIGETLRKVFNSQVIQIITYDRYTDLVNYRYIIEKGERYYVQPRSPIGLSRHIIQTRQPLLLNKDLANEMEKLGGKLLVGDPPRSYLGVPLVAGGEPIGVISLQSIDFEEAFSESDLRLLNTLALNVSVALENARLYQETQRHADQMATIAEVGREIAASLELHSVLEGLASHVHELFKARDTILRMADPGEKSFTTIVSLGKYIEQNRDTIEIGKGITGSIAQNGVAEVIDDLASDPRAIHVAGTPDVEEVPETMMCAPLIASGKTIGILSVYRDRPEGLFTQVDLNFLVGLTRQAAITIENARLYDESRRRLEEMEALTEIGREISSTLDLPTVFDRILTRATRLLGVKDSFIYLVDPDLHRLEHKAGTGVFSVNRVPYLECGEGLSGKVWEGGEPVVVDDYDAWPGRTEKGTGIIHAVVGIPLYAGSEVVGTLALASEKGSERIFGKEEVEFLNRFGQLAAIAIGNARLFEEVQERKLYSEALLEHSPIAIVTIDMNLNLVSWNPGAERLFGYSAEEAIGQNVDTLVSKHPSISFEATQLNEELIEGRVIRTLTQRTHKDGHLVDVEILAIPLIVANERVGAIGIYHDISELLQARREAESANQAKSAFLATMSHEIRTPMNGVIGMSSLLLDTELTKDQREYAEIIRSSGDALLEIINDILDFSKIEAGKMELDEQPFDLRQCVEGTLDLVTTRAVDKGLELSFLLDEEVPVSVVGDANRLRQILLNLLSNAIKFTDQGEVLLTVSLDKEKAAGRGNSKERQNNGSRSKKAAVLYFEISDTGIGIPADRMDRLFQSFSQVDASTARKYGGTGLGLAISKRLSELMGGRMWAESAGVPGKGSRFYFNIRVEVLPQEAGAPGLLKGVQEDFKDKRLLIVDDNDTNRRILVLQTRSWGMLPRDTSSPLTALKWLERGDPFDMAILDMHMPDMDGIELAGKVRELCTVEELPLVLCTSLGRRESGADRLGFAGYLNKPVKPSQLFDVLATVLATQPVVEKKEAPQQLKFDPQMASRHPLRLLLAEDNLVNQKLAIRLLQQMGYQADTAGNGLEVLDKLAESTYDVILMDVQMPEMDGLEATRQIHKKVQAGKRPYIIAMTANAMQGDREMCLEAGMNDYLSKPVRLDELVQALVKARPLKE